MSESELPSLYQSYIHRSRYSRWLWDEKRREDWSETVARYFDFIEKLLLEKQEYTLSKTLRSELESAVLNLEIMPSMRCMMTAGEALEKDQVAGYNCAYVAVDNPRVFDEILYVLCCGTGVGFSVERQFVNQLPVIAEEFHNTDTTIIVPDSKIGWAKSFKELIGLLYQGMVPKIDYTRIRPAGSPLKTFGGRASGPEPLRELFNFTINLFRNNAGNKLQSIECHDLVCKIADIVVVGGTRRSALISLSNVSDDRMRNAKSGQWWIENPHRRLANNSAAYTEKPDLAVYMDEFKALYQSRSGERGIYNRKAAQKQAGKSGRRNSEHNFGVNPCSEILLRSRQFCNLSEVIVRSDDTADSLRRKVRLAAILGTFQSCLTDFRYLTAKWKINCEEERLLGVSLTGIFDSKLMSNPSSELETLLSELKETTIQTNKQYAKKLKINPSAAITCIKPSGTVSQLVDCASGIHPRHSEYYMRTVRANNMDPLCNFMKDTSFKHEPCVSNPENTTIFYFPVEAPKGVKYRKDISAIEHLELWRIYKTFWAEHTVSITISIKEHEWLDVAAYVYKNFDDITGISFLPYSDHIYKQAPYIECSKEDYEELKKKMPDNINWSGLSEYENTDLTEGAQELACTGGTCDL